MRSENKGFIFITTIVILLVLTMLVISIQNSLYLHIKLTNNLINSHKSFYATEELAVKISNNIENYLMPSCINDNLDMNIKKIEKGGCVLEDKERKYNFLIGRIGDYPCLQIKVGDILFSSTHWLIVLAPLGEERLMKIRVATPNTSSSCNAHNFKNINSGIMSMLF
ncbi:MAG: pilus assembly PilX N-terminal domain-containing protein [Legionellaceae bacterium]|nr:pilus assembly PilX N-terminal domain-containing protein [Legionellaceae bacterium]